MITIYHVMDFIRTLYWGVMWVVLAVVSFLIVKVVPGGGGGAAGGGWRPWRLR